MVEAETDGSSGFLSPGLGQESQPSGFPRCFLQISGLPTTPSCSPLSPPLPSCSSPQGTLSCLTQARPVALEEPGQGVGDLGILGPAFRAGSILEESRTSPTDSAGDSALRGQWNPWRQRFPPKYGRRERWGDPGLPQS